jgi:hypothetical protein
MRYQLSGRFRPREAEGNGLPLIRLARRPRTWKSSRARRRRQFGALEDYAKRLELHGDFNGDNRDDPTRRCANV